MKAMDMIYIQRVPVLQIVGNMDPFLYSLKYKIMLRDTQYYKLR